MEKNSPSVSEALARTGAHLERAGSAGRGLSVAEWSNRDNRACYDRPGHHTLSIYLSGGERVVREDGQISGGAPDKLCLLPAGHESRWLIGGPIRMFHLYIDPEVLAYQALTAFDVDPRHVDLMDLTFVDDPAMSMIVRGGVLPLDWNERSDRVALDLACHLLIHHTLRRHIRRAEREIVRGGLSPSVRRRIVDHIEAHLEQALTLDQLASEAGLSTFHFAKMFRISFGMPPHRYLAERRVERARNLLRSGSIELVQVALACGYASQSHFTKAFRSATGITPGEWRNLYS
ncbi:MULTISPECIES: helix-turn-helix domain-containing protein [unclassified Sinorhizobium]|uniref:helix-turn-helix domain-containing protein n=1 Tax=unclassified Sinorhizobium TaxID=2613772 RepID=UPI0035242931